MAVNLSPVAGAAAQFFDNSGQVLTGGKLYTYDAGTTTPAPTYTNSSGLTAQPNPIILNAAGRVPDSGEIWLADSVSYKFVLKDTNDVLIGTYDNLVGINSNFVNFTGEEETQTATQGQTVFTLATLNYQPATNNLLVFVNGSKQVIGTNFTETSSTTVTFVDGLNVGDIVDFCTATPINTSTTTAESVSFTGFKGQIGNVQNLADNNGSDWIGFLPAGTSATARSAQDKMRDFVSVKDFGAVGNGTTDDTVAAQAAVASGNTIYFPAGTYLINGELALAKGQELRGSGRNLTSIKVPDSYAGVLIKLKQGCGVYDMTLTRQTVGTYNTNGTAIQVDNSVADSWNTRVQNVLIQNFNIADNITNYRHTRDQVMYFYNRYGAVVNYDNTAAGSTLFINCAFLYTYVCGLTTNAGTTHTQVKATTFEFAGKHIQNDGVLYVDSCYIADFGAYCIVGTGQLFIENGNVTSFEAGASNQGADYGFNFVTTDNQYALQIANGIVNDVTMGIQYQFITGQSRRGSVLGPGKYVLNNCAFENSASEGPSPYVALYPLEYSATINQQISSNSTKYKNYVTNGTGLDRNNPITGATIIAERNAWGGGVQQISYPTSMVVPFSIPAGTYTLNDPLMLMIYTGTATGAIDIYLNGTLSTGIIVDKTSYSTSTFRQFSSEPVTNVFRAQTGNSYGSTYNVGLTCLIVKCSALTGTFTIAMSASSTTAKIHAIALTPVQNDNPKRVIGWFE